MKIALIDTSPKDMRNQGAINLGFEIVKDKLNADTYHWYEKLNGEYDKIAFNVFYPTNLFNISPFLKNNNIEPYASKRNQKPYIIAGGQGIGKNGILNNIVDEVFHGEIDFEENKTNIVSKYVIKNGKGVIELTRGCKYRCSFCEYGWVAGGKYREKKIELVEQQIIEIRKHGVDRVNFLSANIAGYKDIDKLMEICNANGMIILNGDICLKDAKHIIPHLKSLPKMVKIGVESLSEKTRIDVGKKITDDKLIETLQTILKTANYVHLYLIYGLPNDNYDDWIKMLNRLKNLRLEHSYFSNNLFGEEIRFDTKSIRIETSITNFEPCKGTPFENAPVIDFRKKEEFLKLWLAEQVKCGFLKPSNPDDIDYKNSHGRIGRKELSYKLLMKLKTSGSEITEKLLNTFPKGVKRSILDKEAIKFLND